MSLRGKGKAVLLQAWSGPEGSRKLRFPDFMTTAQDGGKVDFRRCYANKDESLKTYIISCLIKI